MEAFLAAWLDELSAMDALRFCAACRSAREALGANGVAAAAFAVTRPWRANRAGSLRLWRGAWEACSIVSSAFQMRGGAWLEAATAIPRYPEVEWVPDVAVPLDFASGRRLAEYSLGMWNFEYGAFLHEVVCAVLLISYKDATYNPVNDVWEGELQMLVLLENSLFGVAFASSWSTGLLQVTPDPLGACARVIADGFDNYFLAVPERKPIRCHRISLRNDRLSSGMKRLARDGEAYDLFEFAVRCDGGGRAREFWREAPPLDELHSRREIALEEMLTRSALRMLDSR